MLSLHYALKQITEIFFCEQFFVYQYRPIFIFTGGPDRESALHLAARVPDGEKCAEMLLKSGADPNLKKNDGQTPLMLAAYHGNSRVMKLLIEYGAEPVVRSKVGIRRCLRGT